MFPGAEMNGYIRGATNAIMVEILSPDTFVNGGIQFVALDNLGNQQGYFLQPNTVATSAAILQLHNGRLYVEHDRPIPRNTVNGLYRIHIIAAWIPSPFYTGPVSFYASGILANGDNDTTGDTQLVGNLVLYPAIPLDIDPVEIQDTTVIDSSQKLQAVFKNPEIACHYYGGWFFFEVFAEERALVNLDIFDSNSKRVAHETLRLPPGISKNSYQLDLASGMYWVIISPLGGDFQPQRGRFVVVK